MVRFDKTCNTMFNAIHVAACYSVSLICEFHDLERSDEAVNGQTFLRCHICHLENVFAAVVACFIRNMKNSYKCTQGLENCIQMNPFAFQKNSIYLIFRFQSIYINLPLSRPRPPPHKRGGGWGIIACYKHDDL